MKENVCDIWHYLCRQWAAFLHMVRIPKCEENKVSGSGRFWGGGYGRLLLGRSAEIRMLLYDIFFAITFDQ